MTMVSRDTDTFRDQFHQQVGDEGACNYELTTGKLCGRSGSEHDVPFMSTPDAWPAWPILPLKRHRGSQLDCGFMVEQEPKHAKIVYLSTIFEVQKALDDPSLQVRYETFEAVYADGWRVD